MNLVNKDCIGCGACKDVCPRKCIKIKQNSDGFYMAYFDESKCVNCDLCHKICQKNNSRLNKNIDIYAIKNKDSNIRMHSSSGGVFSEISKNWLNKGCVIGASFNKKNKVEHIIIENFNEIKKLNGSKYVQSDLKNIFLKIKVLLINNKYVLFSGTPCQCNALRCYLKYFKLNTNKLLICDIVCHGTPSPFNLEKYIRYQEKINKDTVTNIDFRYKNNDSIQNIKIDFKNGKYISKPRDDIYYYSFFKGYNFMNNCYKCKYTSFNRCGDISLGDFWGCEKSYPDFYDKKGISLMFINTKKGAALFNEISDEFSFIKVSKENCIQPSLIEAIKEPEDNDKFKILLKSDYSEVVDFIGEKNEKSKI